MRTGDEIVQELRKLQDNPAAQQLMRETAFEHARSEYSLASFHARLAVLYAQMLEA